MHAGAAAVFDAAKSKAEELATRLACLLFTFNALSIKLRSHSSERAEIVERARNQSLPRGRLRLFWALNRTKEIRL